MNTWLNEYIKSEYIKSGIVNERNIYTCMSYAETSMLLCRCDNIRLLSTQYSNFWMQENVILFWCGGRAADRRS
jgi:hypothetical protein